MEDYMTSLDVFTPFLFFNLPWKKEDAATQAMFERQWISLRQAMICVFRPDKSKSLASQVASYRRHIRHYYEAIVEVRMALDRYLQADYEGCRPSALTVCY